MLPHSSGSSTPQSSAQPPPFEKPAMVHSEGLGRIRRWLRAHAGMSSMKYVSTPPYAVESTQAGLASGVPSWSATITIGASPWCCAASSSIAARIGSGSGSPGWPIMNTTSGSSGGSGTSAAGGR